MGSGRIVSSGDGVQSKIAELQQRYIGNLPERRSAITDSWEQLNSSISDDVLTALHTHYHKLAGSAGMYGFADMSAAARAAEQALDPYMEKVAQLDAETLQQHADEFAAVVGEIDKVINGN